MSDEFHPSNPYVGGSILKVAAWEQGHAEAMSEVREAIDAGWSDAERIHNVEKLLLAGDNHE